MKNTWSSLSMGTPLRSPSYICRFLKALWRTILRKVRRSMHHRVPSFEAWIVAARGMLYMRASSPKKPVPSYAPTLRAFTSSLPFTKISKSPLQDKLYVECRRRNITKIFIALEMHSKITFRWHRSYLHLLPAWWHNPPFSHVSQTWHPPHLEAESIKWEQRFILCSPNNSMQIESSNTHIVQSTK